MRRVIAWLVVLTLTLVQTPPLCSSPDCSQERRDCYDRARVWWEGCVDCRDQNGMPCNDLGACHYVWISMMDRCDRDYDVCLCEEAGGTDCDIYWQLP